MMRGLDMSEQDKVKLQNDMESLNSFATGIKTKAKYSQCVFMNQGWYSLQELEKIIEKLKAKKDG